MLSKQYQQTWQDLGYLILQDFFSDDQVDLINQLVNNLPTDDSPPIVVDDLTVNKRCLLSQLTKEERQHPLKINNLYLDFSEIRDIALNPELVSIITDLLSATPVLCNTLNLEYGSQQPLHIDSLFMTPRTDFGLIATWIALEDCDCDAGPLVYVPGSHKIPIYRFSGGSPHIKESEFPLWEKYIQTNVEESNLTTEVFLPKKGDVFIWHSQLLHGGSKIRDRQLTRKSLVNHYFTQEDCIQGQSKIDPLGQAFWLNRPNILPD